MMERNELHTETSGILQRGHSESTTDIHLYTHRVHNSQSSQNWDSLRSHQAKWRDLITHGASGRVVRRLLPSEWG